MEKIFAVVRQDLLVFLTRRANLPGLLLTPVVMTIIIALVNGGAFSGAPVRRLDVIDRDASQASTRLLAAIRTANPNLTLCPMDNTAEDICDLGGTSALSDAQALDRVADSTALALLEIPAGFEESLSAQQPVWLTFHSSSTFGVSQPALEAVQAALAEVNTAAVASQVGFSALSELQGQPLAEDQALTIRDALYQRALGMSKVRSVSVDLTLRGSTQKPTAGESLQQGLGQSVPGMGTMYVLMTVFGGMAALIVEREQWTLQRLAVMPVSRGTLLAGKILARFFLGLIQFLVVFAVGALFRMDFGKDPLALLLLAVVYTLAITALSFAIGSGIKNPVQATGLSVLLSLTIAPLGGAWWPMEIAPRFMQVIGHLFPIAWAMDGFTALTYQGARLGDILLPLAVLAGMAAVAFVIAIPRFRYQVD